MIKKLRIKFIVLSMLAVLVLLAVIVTAMNVTNYNAVIAEADEVLDVLSENKGSFPQFGRRDDGAGGPGISDRGSQSEENEPPAFPEDYDEDFEEMFSKRKMSPETPYESRFFSVFLDENGEITETELSRIRVVDSDTAEEYASAVYESGNDKGFIENYRYITCKEETGTRIIFLDCGRKLQAFRNFMLISVLTALAGYVIFFFVIVFFSKRMIRPVVESYEKQKRFITDAGHEIKTPLTIIHADADILEMDIGENEWLDDIQKQTARLTALTNDLIYLAKTEEPADDTQMIEFPLSDIVEEVASSFQGPAKAKNRNLECKIQPMISYKGDEKKIGQLVGILLDNALKYSPENGKVLLALEKQNKNTVLTVYNDTAEEVSKENLDLMFDRFYRMDASRNSKTGGYGIGLSMAKAIVESHGGKIQAKTEDGKSLKMIVTL